MAKASSAAASLTPRARDIRMRRLRLDRRVRRKPFRRLAHGPPVRRDEAGRDGLLRPGAAFEQAELHQQLVGADAAHLGSRRAPLLAIRPPWDGGSRAPGRAAAPCRRNPSTRHHQPAPTKPDRAWKAGWTMTPSTNRSRPGLGRDQHLPVERKDRLSRSLEPDRRTPSTRRGRLPASAPRPWSARRWPRSRRRCVSGGAGQDQRLPSAAARSSPAAGRAARSARAGRRSRRLGRLAHVDDDDVALAIGS